MSSQLMSLMPVLDGANYGLWSKAMKAYLMSIALWEYISMNIPAPAMAADGTPHPDLPKWIKHNQQAMESLILHVAPSIQQDVLCLVQSHEIWEHLDDTYGMAMLIGVYKDFKAALNICINAN